MPVFVGAKVMLFLGDQLVVLRRDHTPGIVWPGMLDFPGGGREGDETPKACAIRETQEEIGLTLHSDQLRPVHLRQVGTRRAWFFTATLPPERAKDIVFGNEGLGWQLMQPEAYLRHPGGIPHFKKILYAAQKKAGWDEPTRRGKT